MIRSSLVLSLIALVAAPALLAQGTLASQGFGYPPGQISTRVLGTGGALAEFDPVSPLNPAALGGWGRSGIYVQYSPEFRTISGTGNESESGTLVRFPVVAAAMTLGSRAVVGLGFSTLLDRTWQTVVADSVILPDDTVTYEAAFRSVGAINDVRLGFSWAFTERLRGGLGVHAFTGENRQQVSVAFDSASFADSAITLPFVQSSALSYDGNAVSAGVEWQVETVAIAFSGRTGGRVRAYSGDTVLTAASAPSRAGASLRYTGIAGTTLAVRANWDEWSTFGDLLDPASTVRAYDGWDIGVGAEVKGPTFAGQDMPLRAGIRRRTLPFSVTGSQVKETDLAVGIGIPLARLRAGADVALQRSLRRDGGDVHENAWTFSIGIAVKP